MTLAQARDIALVLLAIEGIILSIVPLIVLFFIVKGLMALRAKMLILFRQVRLVFSRIAGQTEQVTRTLAQPMMAIEARKAAWSGMARAARRMTR
ncbi:MAG: hypothetical protein IT330_15920 [Anaerolineae bacterium]|nr:hypothetical protein [Anaerolineae bacterium]